MHQEPTELNALKYEPPSLIDTPTAAIYFCFVDDKYDKTSDPNKITLLLPARQQLSQENKVMIRDQPTVSDLCSTLKALFFPDQEVTLTATFSQGGTVPPGSVEYPETSHVTVPINDRSNVVILKTRYAESSSKLNPQTIQILHWLQGNNLDTPEIVNLFLQHRIVLDNIKFLKDSDLINLGIKEWGTRIAILEAINKYFTFLPQILDVQSPRNILDNSQTFAQPLPCTAPAKNPTTTPNKRTTTRKSTKQTKKSRN